MNKQAFYTRNIMNHQKIVEETRERWIEGTATYDEYCEAKEELKEAKLLYIKEGYSL